MHTKLFNYRHIYPGCEAGKIPEQDDLKSPQECNLEVSEQFKESRTAVLVECSAKLNLPKPTSGTQGSEQVNMQLKRRSALSLSRGSILQQNVCITCTDFNR